MIIFFFFLLIFLSCGISANHKKRVLSYGILGAIILRFIFVILGIAVINRFKWVLYIFGILLIISGIKIMFNKEMNYTSVAEKTIANSKIVALLQ